MRSNREPPSPFLRASTTHKEAVDAPPGSARVFRLVPPALRQSDPLGRALAQPRPRLGEWGPCARLAEQVAPV